MQRTLIVIASAGLLSGGPCLGQTNGRFEFGFDRLVVSPASPELTLTVRAGWDQARPGEFVFGGTYYNLAASSGMFTSASLLMDGPANRPGVIPDPAHGYAPAQRLVIGAAVSQVHLPTAGIMGRPDDPIGLAQYTWTTTDFTPRTVTFASEGTFQFFVWPEAGGSSVHLFPHDFTHGVGSITVVPGPAVAAALGAGLLCSWRRRR